MWTALENRMLRSPITTVALPIGLAREIGDLSIAQQLDIACLPFLEGRFTVELHGQRGSLASP